MTSEQQSSATESAPALEERPKTPFDAAAKVVRQVELIAIQFSSYAAQKLSELPDGIGLRMATSFIRPTVTRKEGGFVVTTSLLLNATSDSPDDETPSSIAVVRATVDTEYSFKSEAPEFSEEDLADFAFCYGPFHVWGYWREFVQSSLARLSLPPCTLPLFLISHAPAMVARQD